MVNCRNCNAEIKDHDIKVSIVPNMSKDTVDIDVKCPKCGYKMFARVYTKDFMSDPTDTDGCFQGYAFKPKKQIKNCG